MPPQAPGVGRIVRFLPPDGRQRAAIITRVHPDRTVDLEIFGSSAGVTDRLPLNVPEGQTIGCWQWPQRDEPAAATLQDDPTQTNLHGTASISLAEQAALAA